MGDSTNRELKGVKKRVMSFCRESEDWESRQETMGQI
jgi:hypothetical protein